MSERIAIVGLAGTFAQATGLEEYWGNILHEVDCITDVPATHWSIDDYYDADPKAVDKSYSKRGGFIPDSDFNPLEFGLPPNILECTDVSQLLSLVVAKNALADAGYGEVNPHAENTGVVLGVSALKQITPLVSRLQYPIWKRVLSNRGVAEADSDAIIETIKAAYIEWREDAFPGYLANVVAGRICNRLDLGGINCSIDAACASSMAALQLAAHELQSGNSDVMIAGGVDTNNSIMGYLSFSKTPAFTAHHQMRPFDAASDGMLIGEGVGMLVLRRLADAERDGNRIYAVVSGIGSSSDGKYKSIYAPRQEGQELALRRAYRAAGCRPSSVGLIEAHGTGTPSGDPTELAALSRVFNEDGQARASVAIGSVKSQIGHTKVAAGAASLIKTAMALHDKILPPTINVSAPHPSLEKDDSPFYVNTRARPWFSAEPRRAGVSSFGFGGTNFHVVLEEYSRHKPETHRVHATPFALFLHAADAPALQDACAQMADALTGEDGESHWRSFVQASRENAVPAEAARVGFVAGSRIDAAATLAGVVDALARTPDVDVIKQPGRMHYRRRAMVTVGGVVALFPGQGSQYLEMGRELCMNFPVVHETFAAMDAVLVQQNQLPVSSVVFPAPAFDAQVTEERTRTLRATNNAQAALGAFNLGLYKLLKRSGFTPDFVAGHSLGELTALCAGGAIGEPDYLRLLAARGQAMAAAPESGIDAGTLMAVSGDVDTLAQFVAGHADVTVANRNSRTQLVVAGSRSALAELKSELAALGNTATMLPVSGAFHSRRVAHAQAPFAHALSGVPFSTPNIATYSNSTATQYPDAPDAIRDLLAGHLVSPVDFRAEIETIHRDGGRVFVECGPGAVLTGLVGNILAGEPHLAIALNPGKSGDDDRLLREAYVELRVAGVALNDLDPYQAPPEVTVKKRGLVVRLNGAPYVSETTRAAFESALERTAGTMASDHQGKRLLEQTVTLTGDTSSLAHQRYLENMAGHSARYFDLMERLHGLITTSNCTAETLAMFERGMGQFHEQQLTAQQVHSQYLKNQVEYSQRVLQTQSEPLPSMTRVTAAAPPLPLSVVASEAPRPVAVRPALPRPEPPVVEVVRQVVPIAAAKEPVAAPVHVQAPGDADEIAAILISVISEKTGYPVDTLDPSMDLDSDLGIDSLKRVEVMAALEGRLFNSLAGIDFEAFAALRTISQIAQHLAGAALVEPGR
jgi:polyketide-type polyunsaturated fatty acid synthase PfaA